MALTYTAMASPEAMPRIAYPMDLFYSLCFYSAFRFEGFPWLACIFHSAEKSFGVCKDEP